MFDTANLDAIVQETRTCFLYEDVPDYMAALARDTQRLFGKCDPSTRAPLPDADRQAIYTDLMRTAHSLKGGAAIAQLPHLSRLAHQLEDLLEALGQGRIENIQPACALLSRGIEHVDLLVAAAMRAGDIGEAETAATLAIYDELDQLLSVLPVHTEADAMADITPAAPNASVLKSALSVDLEECLQRVETQIGSSASPARVQEVLANFTEECLLLAQVLSQTWLSELAEGLRTVAATASPELSEMAIATVSAIREQRDLVLVDMGASPVIPTPTASPGNTPIADLLADTERLPESNSTPDSPDLFGPDKLTELEGEQLPSNIGERLNPLPQESSEEEAFDVLAILEPNTAAPTFFDELPDDLPSSPVEGEDFAFFDDLPDAVEPSPSETAEPMDMSQWDVGHSLNELDDIFGAAPEASVIEDPYSLMDVAFDDSTIASEFIVGSHSVADDLGAAALDTSSATIKDEANADSISNSSATEAAPVEVGSEFAPEAVAADLSDAPPAIAQTIPPDVSESALEHLISELGETAPPPKLDDSTALPVSDVSPVSEITSSLTSETGGAKLPGEDSNRRPHSVVLPRVRQSTAASQQPLPDLKLRMPVSRLDRIDNTLGELLIVRERLVERHRQLEAASRNLQIRAQQLSPINDRVREFYDRLAVEGHSTLPSSETAAAIEDATLTEEATLSLKTSLASTNQDFDALEFDRYTDFHSTLQDLQELMVQVQESRADIDLISDGFHNALDDLRDRLSSLRGDLRDSRFVPFRVLAAPFRQPLISLNQEHHKSVELFVDGADTPIDQTIVEQLQAPLQHLFRNAFDHGIETPAERQAAGKLSTARISLSAAIQGNRVEIVVRDDGRGIDEQKVLEKAIAKGLCQAEQSLPPQQIYEFLFAPGFSTAASVSSLSGRGVGLDVVRLQVERLHGTIRIESQLGYGTAFILSIPLSLNIAPLLVCRCQQRMLALPSSSILTVVKFDELEREGDRIIWQGRGLPVYSLLQLLPYSDMPAVHSDMPLILIVSVAGTPVALGVDALVSERELVIKSFDATVAVPSYLMGCTVLGSGEVLPVVAPDGFQERLESVDKHGTSVSAAPATIESEPTILIVDDSIAVRRMLDRILRAGGYRVVQCRDGKEALEVLERPDEHFDVVLSDIEMPRLDGFGLLREIRASERWRTLPVAMLTSRENDRHRRRAAELGTTAYFTKPFKAQQLLQDVAKMVTHSLR